MIQDRIFNTPIGKLHFKSENNTIKSLDMSIFYRLFIRLVLNADNTHSDK